MTDSYNSASLKEARTGLEWSVADLSASFQTLSMVLDDDKENELQKKVDNTKEQQTKLVSLLSETIRELDNERKSNMPSSSRHSQRRSVYTHDLSQSLHKSLPHIYTPLQHSHSFAQSEHINTLSEHSHDITQHSHTWT